MSKTVPYAKEEVWDLLTSPDGIAAWVGPDVVLDPQPGAPYQGSDGVVGEVRSFHPVERIRLTWQPADWDRESIVQVTVSGDTPGKTRIGFHQERLADADQRERQRAHWQAVMARLVEALEG